jgi:predicted RNA-binding Zn ribbon-like protein
MRTDWHALGFTKTRGWEARDRQADDLADYAGLASWCERRGILSGAEARAYRALALSRPRMAGAAVHRAHDLRRSIYDVLRHVGTGNTPTREQLDDFTARAKRYARLRRLEAMADGVTWTWRLDPGCLEHPLAPIAWSMTELLVSPELARVHLCEADDCGWLFVDGSRPGSRRWCDMSDCGNLAKVRRFRARKRQNR